MEFQGVIYQGIYSKRKDYLGFAFDFVIVLGVINKIVLYYPCDERGIIISNTKYFPNKFFKNRFFYIELKKFVKRYEVYQV